MGIDRVVLAFEMIVGVLPITVVGGLYSILGLYVSPWALLMSLWMRAPAAFGLWLGVFALAAGGLFGIVGLWLVILLSWPVLPPRAQLARTALGGSVVGVVTAVAALSMMAVDSRLGEKSVVVAVVVAPVLVVLHRLPRISRIASSSV